MNRQARARAGCKRRPAAESVVIEKHDRQSRDPTPSGILPDEQDFKTFLAAFALASRDDEKKEMKNKLVRRLGACPTRVAVSRNEWRAMCKW